MKKSKTPISDFDYLINEGNSSGIHLPPTQTEIDEEKGTTKYPETPEIKRVIIAPELYPIFLFYLTKIYQNAIYFTLYFLQDYYLFIFTKKKTHSNDLFLGIIISGFSLTTVSLLLLKKCYHTEDTISIFPSFILHFITMIGEAFYILLVFILSKGQFRLSIVFFHLAIVSIIVSIIIPIINHKLGIYITLIVGAIASIVWIFVLYGNDTGYLILFIILTLIFYAINSYSLYDSTDNKAQTMFYAATMSTYYLFFFIPYIIVSTIICICDSCDCDSFSECFNSFFRNDCYFDPENNCMVGVFCTGVGLVLGIPFSIMWIINYI